MRKTINGKKTELGFTLYERRGRLHPEICICDLDLADNIVFNSDKIQQALLLLYQVELECKTMVIGLLCVKKAKCMFFNVTFNVDVSLLSTVASDVVKQSLIESGDQDFKYLGSWGKKDRDINT